MSKRLAPFKVVPAAYKTLWALQEHVDRSDLDHILLELVKTRASQINHCARCVALHTRDARRAGETEERLYLLSAWPDAPVYSERERAALAWTEAVTRISEAVVPDTLYDTMTSHFTDTEIVNLTMAIIAINSWNRINVVFEVPFPAANIGTANPVSVR